MISSTVFHPNSCPDSCYFSITPVNIPGTIGTTVLHCILLSGTPSRATITRTPLLGDPHATRTSPRESNRVLASFPPRNQKMSVTLRTVVGGTLWGFLLLLVGSPASAQWGWGGGDAHHHHDAAGHRVDDFGHHIDQHGHHTGNQGFFDSPYHSNYYTPSFSRPSYTTPIYSTPTLLDAHLFDAVEFVLEQLPAAVHQCGAEGKFFGRANPHRKSERDRRQCQLRSRQLPLRNRPRRIAKFSAHPRVDHQL